MTQSPNRTPEADEAFEPTWFLSPLDTPANDELAERYRNHREAEPAPLRDLIRARSPAEAAVAYEDDEPPIPRQIRKSRPRASLAKTYALAAVGAIVAGAASGYSAAELGPMAIEYATGTSIELSRSETETDRPGLVPVTELGKKPVPTALLMVTDAEGSANTPIPLMVMAEPPAGEQEILLKISGVPSSAYLTSGWKIAAGTWHVRQPDLGNLNLVSTDNASQRFDLAIAGFEAQTGELVTPVKEVMVSIKPQPPAILPAAAPPPTVQDGVRH